MVGPGDQVAPERVAVVVNPRAGGGKPDRTWRDLLAARPELAGVHLVRVADSKAARAALAETVGETVERVIVVGGDGTTHLVGNVLLDRGLGTSLPMAMIPCGTGSDLARTLGIPRDAKLALERALSRPARPIDVLEVRADDGRTAHALNVFSAGISGVVDEKMIELRRSGTATYLRATLATLFSFHPPPCRVIVGTDQWHDGPLMLLAVANSPTFGDGMKIAPGALPDDGEADVILAGPVPRWQLLFRLIQVYRGTHVRSRIVRAGRATRIRVEPGSPFPPFDLDGETFPPAAASIRVIRGGLRFVW